MKNQIITLIIEALPQMANHWIEMFSENLLKDIKELALAGDDIEGYVEFAISNINQ